MRSSFWIYGVTLGAVFLATVWRFLLDPILGDNIPYATFFAAVACAAWIGGWRAGIIATTSSLLVAAYFFVPPRWSLVIGETPHVIGMGMFFLVSLVICGFGEAMRRAQQQSAERSERLRTTLASIGDAVITTDVAGTITNLNPVAESLTAWSLAEARGQPLDVVFRIINEVTRQAVENPATRALRDGVIVGLANHTILIAKDGTERPIDDSASPIRCQDGEVVGCVLVFRDVTERRRTEQHITQSEALKTAILDTALDCIITIDHQGSVLDFNPAAERTFGYRKEAVLGREMAELIVPASMREAHRRGMAHYLETGIGPVLGKRLELTAVRADGSEFPVELAITRIPGHGPPLFTAYLRDITEQKRATEQLQTSEERYRTLFDGIDEGFCVIEFLDGPHGPLSDYVHIQANPAYARHTGIPNVVGQRLRDMVPAEADDWLARYRPVLETGRPIRFEQTLVATGRHLELSSFRVEPPELRQVAVLFSDVTARDQAEKSLRNSEAQYRLIVQGNPALICRFRPDGTLTFVNDTYCRTFGKTREELVGESFAPLIPDEDRPVVARLIERLKPEMEPFTDEHRVVVATGAVRWQRWTNMAVVDGGGTLVEYQAVGIDITDRKLLEDELRQVAAELSDADHRKDEFLATLAHELRNPLAPIRNALQIMGLSTDREAIEQSRQMMERQLSQMVRLVDDLLDVSRITSGKLELRKEPVELSVVVNSALEASRPLIEQMGHELGVVLPSESLMVHADLTRLAQVLINILNNAAKYSERGGRISLTAERDGENVVFSVKDSGIGIPAEKLEGIFELFSQVDRSLEKAQGGLGIGLTLVRRLVELHGGMVKARSAGPGKGSEFIVRLPIVIEPVDNKLAVTPNAKTPRPKLRILIVDDNKDGADSLAMMLKLLGNETRTAHDGLQGLAAAEEFRPSVALFDIGMPKLNGYEACRRIREQPWGCDMFLIAVTGWGQDEDRRRSREAGFNHHLVKPVDPGELIKLLAQLPTTSR